MEPKVCSNCRRMFTSMLGEILCPECNKAAEEVLREVKDYIRENPGCNIKEVVAAFPDSPIVTEKQVRAWVKGERLQFVSAAACGLTCETCGKPIISGRFCDKCRVAMQKNLSNAFLDKMGKSDHVEERKSDFTKNDRMYYIKSKK